MSKELLPPDPTRRWYNLRDEYRRRGRLGESIARFGRHYVIPHGLSMIAMLLVVAYIVLGELTGTASPSGRRSIGSIQSTSLLEVIVMFVSCAVLTLGACLVYSHLSWDRNSLRRSVLPNAAMLVGLAASLVLSFVFHGSLPSGDAPITLTKHLPYTTPAGGVFFGLVGSGVLAFSYLALVLLPVRIYIRRPTRTNAGVFVVLTAVYATFFHSEVGWTPFWAALGLVGVLSTYVTGFVAPSLLWWAGACAYVGVEGISSPMATGVQFAVLICGVLVFAIGYAADIDRPRDALVRATYLKRLFASVQVTCILGAGLCGIGALLLFHSGTHNSGTDDTNKWVDIVLDQVGVQASITVDYGGDGSGLPNSFQDLELGLLGAPGQVFDAYLFLSGPGVELARPRLLPLGPDTGTALQPDLINTADGQYEFESACGAGGPFDAQQIALTHITLGPTGRLEVIITGTLRDTHGYLVEGDTDIVTLPSLGRFFGADNQSCNVTFAPSTSNARTYHRPQLDGVALKMNVSSSILISDMKPAPSTSVYSPYEYEWDNADSPVHYVLTEPLANSSDADRLFFAGILAAIGGGFVVELALRRSISGNAS